MAALKNISMVNGLQKLIGLKSFTPFSRLLSTNVYKELDLNYPMSGGGIYPSGCSYKFIRDRFDSGQNFVSVIVHGEYEFIRTEIKGKKNNIGFVLLDRPKALNAFSDHSIVELNQALSKFDNDPSIGCTIISGKGKTFAAGADIRENWEKNRNFSMGYNENYAANWEDIARNRKPIIAAVNGFALGGGCEVAMMCDIIYASNTARFGLPEIRLGTIPGAGGTQRLPRAVGKSMGMELLLTGSQIDAATAKKAGLVSKVFPLDDLLDETLKTAEKIAENSKLISMIAKSAINKTYETSLAEGLFIEKNLFYSSFGTVDRTEGMTAFIEKRSAEFHDK